ncbi:hypothetical protein ACO0LF_09735 [Undibacterium sp. Di27W]|uniref:hypothetical protein n=1 Tax=Undibacterium sp. Di27W TaxID=3413036 RepID=UPI003BF03CB5
MINLSNAANAPDHNSAAQAKVVSRLYELTVIYQDRCARADPAAAQEYKTELQRFNSTYPKLQQLLTASPHYATAVSNYKNEVASESNDEKQASTSDECRHMSFLLRSMTDTPEGAQAVKEYVDILSK